MRHVLFFALLLLVAAGCKDFTLSSSTGRLLVVEVDPPIARAGVEVRVTVSGSTSGDLQVSLLGQLLSKDASGAFVYLVTGHEPEGVDLVVQASAGSSSGTGRLRFDFTPPDLLSVGASPGSAPAGQQVQLTLTANEPLSAPPSLEIQARAAPCTADQTEPQIYFCTFLPQSSDTPGYQVGTATLTDLAGNTRTIAKVGLGLVLDFGQALTADGTVTPSPASRGTTLSISFTTSRALAAPPTATVGDQPAQLISGPDSAGQWEFHYLVTGAELGPVPSQGPVSVAALADGVSLSLPSVTLDFRPPGLTSATPDRTLVGLPAAQANVVTIAVKADEDLSVLTASIQGRSAGCQHDDGDAQDWRCTYTADGTESEGPQRVVFYLVDLVGNPNQVTSEDLFSFAFHPQLDATKVFVLWRFGDHWKFVADPGAAAPGASLAVRVSGAQDNAFTATCAPDGSVAEMGDLGTSLPSVGVQATDPAGNVSAWVPARIRFGADTGHKPANGFTNAWKWQGGTATPVLAEFSESGGVSQDELQNLASTDTPVFEVTTSQVDPVDWVRVQPSASSVEPVLLVDEPLAYFPGKGVVHFDSGDQASAELFVWNGASWTPYDSDPQNSPSPVSMYGMAVDSLQSELVLEGGYDDSNYEVIQGTWLGQIGTAMTWSQLASPTPAGTPPDFRFGSFFVFDRASGNSVLFGGQTVDDSGDVLFFGDTWLLGAAGWAEVTPIASPLARASPGYAYDAARGKGVLFGGQSTGQLPPCSTKSCANGSCLGCDTWEWSGSEWRQRQGEGPSPRAYLGMAWNAVRGNTILFGGWGPDAVPLGDTWELTLSGWQPLSTAHSPPPLSDHGMAYDELRGRVVVFGGQTADGNPSSDLWELTEDGLFPGVVARLDTTDLGSTPSALTVRVVGSGISSRYAANGLVVSLWDSTTNGWTQVAAAAPADALATISATISGSDVPHYLSGQTLLVLVTAPASSVDGPSVLRVDAINAFLDW